MSNNTLINLSKMTFIASVIARSGVCIIADSLVTTTQPVIEYGDFINFFSAKSDAAGNNKITLDPMEVIKLFERKPHHTKDFEEKLFEYDKYTAVTTAGSAIINKKRISELIKEQQEKNLKTRGYNNKKIETKIKDLCNFLTDEVKDGLKKENSSGRTTLLVTNYNRYKNLTKIFKIRVHESSKNDLKEENHEFVSFTETHDFEKVVCEGQNRISERVLFGDYPTIFGLVPKIVNKIANDFNIDRNSITEDYLKTIREDENIISKNIYSDVKILKLNELSLQQAVDLATLLMRLEIDFQNYTENIPTVGGVIKLAVIDSKGFRFISGHEITKPNNI